MTWKIAVYQIPVGIGDARHNFIVVKDDAGNAYAEFNGGPVDGNGRFIALNPADLATINSRLSGGVVGADVRLASDRPLYRNNPDAQLIQETPVTQDQALAALNAAASCARDPGS